MVEGEIGVQMDDLKKYDPRQYDPRKIIREAWDDTGVEELVDDTRELVSTSAGVKGASKGSGRSGSSSSKKKKDEGPKRAPFDDEAT
jgi:sec-independent protein translocase protein TatB